MLKAKHLNKYVHKLNDKNGNPILDENNVQLTEIRNRYVLSGNEDEINEYIGFQETVSKSGECPMLDDQPLFFNKRFRAELYIDCKKDDNGDITGYYCEDDELEDLQVFLNDPSISSYEKELYGRDSYELRKAELAKKKAQREQRRKIAMKTVTNKTESKETETETETKTDLDSLLNE